MGKRNNIFLLKRSNTPNKVPIVGDLLLGELALNTADAILYTSGSTSNTIRPIGWDRISRNGDTMNGNLTVNGSISGTTYYGDGSNLTGVNATVSLIRKQFDYLGVQSFTLDTNYSQVYSIEVNGGGSLKTDQYTLNGTNGFTILDTLDVNDYIVVIYSANVLGVVPYYSQAQVDVLLANTLLPIPYRSIVNLGNVTGAVSINWNLGVKHKLNLTGNITITQLNFAGYEGQKVQELEITSSSPTHTITWTSVTPSDFTDAISFATASTFNNVSVRLLRGTTFQSNNIVR